MYATYVMYLYIYLRLLLAKIEENNNYFRCHANSTLLHHYIILHDSSVKHIIQTQ